MYAFLIIEKPYHADTKQRRTVTAWLPEKTAEELQHWLKERAGQTNEYVEVTFVPQVRTR